MSDSTPAPAALADALADRYRLLRELGRGGMATVYLAEDVRHKRQVAIKVLHPELSAVIGAERFLKEIELTANLQHPHILPLFDSGSAAGQLYYVMPFIDGETLRGRLEREQQLSVAESVRIAREVADALAYAHGRNVVHRDIKPENILLQGGVAGGHALVADFGIALAVQQAGGSRMTQTGMSLGTPQYMAPEQAMGERVVDARADVYALGAVTYEMLAGEPPFTGPTTQAIVAKMMTERPTALHTVRDTVPDGVERAVMTALAKLPADRWESAAKFAEALTAGGSTTVTSVNNSAIRGRAAIGVSRGGRPWWQVAAGAAVLVALGAVAATFTRSNAPTTTSTDVVEFDFDGSAIDVNYAAFSPDGRRVAFVSRDSLGREAIALRDLGSARTRFLAADEEPGAPAISADGRSVYFVNGRDAMRKIAIDGGAAQGIPTTTGGNAYITTVGDSIVGSALGMSLRIMSPNGGRSRILAQRDSTREFALFSPAAIPGRRTLLFCSYSTLAEKSRVEALDLDTGKRTVLIESACQARYAPSGHLVFIRGDALYAVAFDIDRLRVTGTPVRVVDDVLQRPSTPGRAFDISANGNLMYSRASVGRAPRQLVVRTRDGKMESLIPTTATFLEPRLSPDGRTVLVTEDNRRRELWMVDVARRQISPLLKGEGDIFSAAWYADSKRFAYAREAYAYELYRSAIDGSVSDSMLLGSSKDKYPNSVAADGSSLWFTGGDERARMLDLRTGTRRLVLKDSTPSPRPSISPNAKWVAYESFGGTGARNVVITSSDGTGTTHRVSVDGGAEAIWTRGGRELVYRNGTAMMAAEVNPETGDVSAPALLFRASAAPTTENKTRSYDVSADGSRFVMVEPVPGGAPLNVIVVNWVEELKRKMAASH